MEDLISREAVEMCLAADVTDMEVEDYISMVSKRIKELPSVTPKQKMGHWVNGEYCSECGCDVPAYIIDWKWQKDMNAKYCPNCGAKMSENPTGSNSSEKPNKWIPVSERLPEERGVYIVTEKVFSLDDREHKGRYNTMVEQVEYYNGKWRRANFFEVIAWMPLPEPYKESEGEE